MIFTYREEVSFKHVDPAGIIFYPRYMEMVNSTIEAFFKDYVEYSFTQMIVNDGKGVPTVKLEVDFSAPSVMEDMLVFDLSIIHIGRSSADLMISCHCGGEERMSVRITIVFMDRKSRKSEAWPADIKQKLEVFSND